MFEVFGGRELLFVVILKWCVSREKGEGRREKGEGRREKGEGRREKGEGRGGKWSRSAKALRRVSRE